MDLEFITREMVDGDRNFIFNSYLKSYRKTYPLCLVPNGLYFGPQQEILEFLLNTASATVACFPEDPSEILGYIIHQNQPTAAVLHFLYAKRASVGIRSGLLAGAVGEAPMVVATHLFRDYKWLENKITPKRVVYDPYLIQKLRGLR